MADCGLGCFANSWFCVTFCFKLVLLAKFQANASACAMPTQNRNKSALLEKEFVPWPKHVHLCIYLHKLS